MNSFLKSIVVLRVKTDEELFFSIIFAFIISHKVVGSRDLGDVSEWMLPEMIDVLSHI